MKGLFKKLLLTAMLGTVCLAAFAQGKTISGTVRDEAGDPVVGAYVLDRAANNGTMTGTSGEFTLRDVRPGAVVLVSCLGFEDNQFTVGQSDRYDIVLGTDVSTLNEALVIGYGTIKKADMTGSASSLSSDDFQIGSNLTAEQVLRGSVPGINIQQNSGKPGGSYSIRVRGGTSITASNDPLYVIDGVPISASGEVSRTQIRYGAGYDLFDQEEVDPLSALNPADIESITVLKDASATAIYGSRGANGVIMITTKKGRTGKAQVEYSGNVSIATVAKKLDVLNAKEYTDLINKLGLPLDNKGSDTNWQDEIYRNAFSHNHHVALTGGNEKTQYRASVGFNNQQGVIKGSGVQNLNNRINISHSELNDRLKIDLIMAFSQQDADQAQTSNTVGSEMGTNILYEAYVFNPTYPVINPQTGDYYDVAPYRVNPVSYTTELIDQRKNQKYSANASVSYKIIEPLTIQVNGGYDSSNTNRYSYIPKANLLGNTTNGLVNMNKFADWSKLFEAYLKYNQTFGKHTIDALAGYSYQYFFNEGLIQMAQGFLSDEFKWYKIGAASNFDAPTSFTSDNKLISMFGRVNYNYDDRYLVTATLRRDGSSRFGADHKWGYFPSAAFAWRINHEDFFDVDWVSNLKFRATWGVTGSQEIGNYQSLNTLSPGSNAYLIGGNKITIVMPTQYSNPDLKWEETAQTDLGLDFGFFGGRIEGSFDWYRKVTSDLLYSVDVPSPSYITKQTANVGSVRNRGIEFALNGIIIDKRDMTWSANANVSHNDNMVLSLTNDKYAGKYLITGGCQGQGLSGQYSQIIQENSPLGTFYGKRFTGLDANGMETYANDGASEVIGCAQPDLVYGFGTNFRYKRFSVSANFHGTVGNDIYNNTANNHAYLSNLPGRNVMKDALTSGVSIGQPKTFSSRWIEDGSFLRMDNLTFAYEFDVKNTFLSRAQLYCTAQNLFVLTKYSGLDPEVNSKVTGNGTAPIGTDYLSYPKARTFSLGVNLTF